MADPTVPPRVPIADSTEKIRKFLAGYAGLYAPSVIAEAATLLDTYLDAAEQRGLDRAAANADGWLTAAAAESISRQYASPKQERTSTELHGLLTSLRAALTAEGLEIVPTPVRMGVGIAPLPGGPTWGMGRGLAIAMYIDSGWELMANSERTRVHAIHAPASAAGAAEVAQIVHAVLQGTEPDPFRRRD